MAVSRRFLAIIFAVLLGLSILLAVLLVRLRVPAPDNEDEFSVVAENFTQLTFLPGGRNDFDDTVEYLDGLPYHVKVNLTTIETGIVSLAEAGDLLDHVSCSDNGTIRITFFMDVHENYLDAMFPNGSMLVIDGSKLGSCYLGFDDDDEEGAYWTENFANSTEDGYLAIETVSRGASQREVEIRGSRASFFFMFEEADFLVEPVNEEGVADPFATYNSTDFGDRRLAGVGRSFDIQKRYPPGKGALLQLWAGMKFTVYAGMGWDVKWKLRKGITLSISFDYELTIKPELGIALYSGTQSKNGEYPFFSYPLFGIPEIRLLKKLKLTEPKLGAYFEVAYFLEYFLKTDVGSSMVASSTMSTGRKKIEFYVKGKWSGLSAGARTITNKAAACTAPGLDIKVPDDISAEIKLFTGVQPGVWLYLFGLGRAGVFQRTGIELDADASSAGFPPARSNGLQLGPCDSCHNFQASADVLVENLSYEFSMRFKMKLWFLKINKGFRKVGKLPGDLRVDLLTACALERTDMTPCSAQCCKQSFKCVSGTCRATDGLYPPAPQIRYAGDNDWNSTSVSVKIEVLNSASISPELFQWTNEFGLCTSSGKDVNSRTWIRIMNNKTDEVLHTLCDFDDGSVPRFLNVDLAFQNYAILTPYVRIELWDRQLDESYSSNAIYVDFVIVI